MENTVAPGTQRETLLIKVSRNVYPLRTNVFYYSRNVFSAIVWLKIETDINSRRIISGRVPPETPRSLLLLIGKKFRGAAF